MGIEAVVVADSVNVATGDRLTTFQLRYPRFIHGEVMSHRCMSRNAGSSRAIPVKKVIAQVWNDPAMPVHWGANQPGMQAHASLGGWKLKAAKLVWRGASRGACLMARAMLGLGLHKQIANRVLEPWQYINVVLSGTEWEGFYALRCHPDAQPEMQSLATAMRSAQRASPPAYLQTGEWHLPYVQKAERDLLTLKECLALSTSRCGRVSYKPFDGSTDWAKEIALHDKLVAATPIHASPLEHQAQARQGWARNFRGFLQYRTFVEGGRTPR